MEVNDGDQGLYLGDKILVQQEEELGDFGEEEKTEEAGE